jgi:serine/threonine-protein kinase
VLVLDESCRGAVLAGRYRLERELGRGGMGAVWAGLDERLERPVAIKLLAEGSDAATNDAERFEREAKAIARLRSPYVVQLYDYGVEDGIPFMIMELLEGVDLATVLRQREKLGLDRTTRIVLQVAKALATAHEAGVVHRDLKPGNIFLLRHHDEEHVKVVDFGVAKAHGEWAARRLTTRGSVLGTPRYMAPEQILPDGVVDARTDLWALAVITYKALTGRAPFKSARIEDLIEEVLNAVPPPPRRIEPALPRAVDRYFEKALAKRPAERFQSALEMAHALADVAELSYSLTKPGPEPEPTDRVELAREPQSATVVERDDTAQSTMKAAPAPHAALRLLLREAVPVSAPPGVRTASASPAEPPSETSLPPATRPESARAPSSPPAGAVAGGDVAPPSTPTAVAAVVAAAVAPSEDVRIVEPAPSSAPTPCATLPSPPGAAATTAPSSSVPASEAAADPEDERTVRAEKPVAPAPPEPRHARSLGLAVVVGAAIAAVWAVTRSEPEPPPARVIAHGVVATSPTPSEAPAPAASSPPRSWALDEGLGDAEDDLEIVPAPPAPLVRKQAPAGLARPLAAPSAGAVSPMAATAPKSSPTPATSTAPDGRDPAPAAPTPSAARPGNELFRTPW